MKFVSDPTQNLHKRVFDQEPPQIVKDFKAKVESSLKQQSIIEPTEDLYKLTVVVLKAVEDFNKNKDNHPTRVFLNDKDFSIKGEIDVCGYKVMTTYLVPQGQAIVVDDSVNTIFDRL